MSQPASARTVVGALLSVTGVGLAGAGAVMLVQGPAHAEATDQVYVCKYKATPDPEDEGIKPGKNPIVVSVSTLDLTVWPGTFPWTFPDGQFTSVAIGYAGGANPVLTEGDCVAPRTDPTDVPTTEVPTTDVPTTDVPTTDVPTTDVPSKPVAGVVETTTPPTGTPTPTTTGETRAPGGTTTEVAPVPRAVDAGAGPVADDDMARGLALGVGGGLLALLGAGVAVGGSRPRGRYRA